MKTIRYMALTIALLAMHTASAARLRKLTLKEGCVRTLSYKDKVGHIWKVEAIKLPGVVGVEILELDKTNPSKKSLKFHAGQPGTTMVLVTHGKPGEKLSTKEFKITVIKAKAKKAPTVKTTKIKVKTVKPTTKTEKATK